MNDLSLRVLNHVSGVNNFFKNINKGGEKNLYSQMDVKVFFSWEGDNEQKKKNTKSKKKQKAKSKSS